MDARERLLTRISILSLFAGLIHGAVTPDHFREWWGYGLFFLLSGLAQAGYGAIPLFTRMVEDESILARWRPASVRAFAWAGIAGNASIVALYVVSRTVGIPFLGPDAGEVAVVRPLDLLSKVIEIVLILALVAFLRRR